jgi:hypothetical protein
MDKGGRLGSIENFIQRFIRWKRKDSFPLLE